MKAAIYIRVSTDMQAEDGFSIEGQRTRLTSFAESQDWIIHDEYIDEGFSAKDLERPEMQRLLQDMKEKKFDVILVYKLDRLTRSVSDLHGLLKTFDLYSVKFKSATEIFETTTAMGRFFITIVAAMAEWERGTISERVRFGIEQKLIEGKRPGGNVPYGYTQDEQLIPEEAALIRKVRDLYLSGIGTKSIAMKMNREGLLRRGNEWTSATVAYTLENPYYAGTLRLAARTPEGHYVNIKRDERLKCMYSEGSHEAIFSKEEYQAIKTMMERKTHGGFSQIKTYWYSGVLRCGRCGSAMFGRLTTQRSKASGEIVRTQYYICGKRHGNSACDLPVFRQSHIEHLTMDYIRKIRLDVEMISEESKHIVQEESKKENALAEAKRALVKCSERREKWQYMFVEGLISKTEVRKRILEEEEIEKEIKQKIAENQNAASGIPKLDGLAEMEEVWDLLDDAEKKDLIFTLFSKITVNTDLEKVKGVRNKFFDAYLQEVAFN